LTVDLDTLQGNRGRCPVFGLAGRLRNLGALMADTKEERQARLQKALEAARNAGNPFMVNNIMKAMQELAKDE
jgi:hypothetical protein|tara:strand:+ start:1462 stop:1680 length:219 start_codon:yes stop_codon:yes gene_type:complete